MVPEARRDKQMETNEIKTINVKWWLIRRSSVDKILCVFLFLVKYLTHWDQVMHMCVSRLTIIGSDNDLSPGRCQAITWTNAGILLIEKKNNLANWMRVSCWFMCLKKLAITSEYYRNIVNWTLGNKLQWNLNQNSYIFIQENAFQNVVWKMAPILSRPRCVNFEHGSLGSGKVPNLEKNDMSCPVVWCFLVISHKISLNFGNVGLRSQEPSVNPEIVFKINGCPVTHVIWNWTGSVKFASGQVKL